VFKQWSSTESTSKALPIKKTNQHRNTTKPKKPETGSWLTSGLLENENGTQIQKHLLFAAKPLAITAHAGGGTIKSLHLFLLCEKGMRTCVALWAMYRFYLMVDESSKITQVENPPCYQKRHHFFFPGSPADSTAGSCGRFESAGFGTGREGAGHAGGGDTGASPKFAAIRPFSGLTGFIGRLEGLVGDRGLSEGPAGVMGLGEETLRPAKTTCGCDDATN
jgi:hypothetical protein